MSSYKVPQAVQNNAKRGLELRRQWGRGGLTTAQAGEQGIGSGVARARDLMGGSVSLETVRRMSAFFDRHRKNKDTPPEKGNGMISWLLWGGDAGDRWAKGILRQVESAKELTKTIAGRKLPASAFLVVGDKTKVTTWALPVRNPDGTPDNARMGAAWAALHGGYRGNKYEGEGKAQAITKLRRMYEEQGREVPGEKGKAVSRNWAAGAGETIGGGLARADDGKFTAAGEGGGGSSRLEMISAFGELGVSKRDLQAWEALQSGDLDKVSPAQLNKFKRLGFVDENGKTTTNGKAFTTAVEKNDANAIMALKPQKGGAKPKKGGAGKAPKPAKPTREQVETANIAKVTQELGSSVSPKLLSDVVAFSKSGTLPQASITSLVKAGLLASAGGGYVSTPEGKRLRSALASGNTAQAREAILRGRERASRQTDKQLHGRVWVTTDKEGKYRWVAISSNSYQDREGEIVSQKALAESVERGDKGDLLWWHEKGATVGECDFQMIHGRMLIESGTFKSQKIGAAFAKLKGLGVSVGFRHPANEPINGVYENIQIFERSILPAHRAANGLTSFGVM